MKKVLIILTIFSFVMSSCKQESKPVAVTDDMEFYGEQITADNAITYDELYAQLTTADSIDNVKIIGTIDGVCQAKGCWMTIASDLHKDDESIFVKFKDYGFFMPLDASGRTAILEGKAYREMTSVEELRHYAEDEGKSAEEIAAITEPTVELKFMAHGVVLKK